MKGRPTIDPLGQRVLVKLADGPLTGGQLAKRTGHDFIGVHTILHAMETLGLVTSTLGDTWSSWTWSLVPAEVDA